MPQSLAQIFVHIVFSTKNRKPWLRDESLRDELYAYMAINKKMGVIHFRQFLIGDQLDKARKIA